MLWCWSMLEMQGVSLVQFTHNAAIFVHLLHDMRVKHEQFAIDRVAMYLVHAIRVCTVRIAWPVRRSHYV